MTPLQQKKIKKATSIEMLFDMTEEEADEWRSMKVKPIQGLTNFDIDTSYNAHCILSLQISSESMGAYPSSNTLFLNFDKRTGDKMLYDSIIEKSKTDELVAKCNAQIKKYVESKRKELIGKLNESELEFFDATIGATEEFTAVSLDNYLFDGNKIVFKHQYAFPHAIQALQPEGDITFSKAEFKPYIRKDGPLAFWLQ